MDDYRPDVKAEMDKLLLGMPGVTGGKMFGYPAYKINGKVFAFVGGAGISIKLPAKRVGALIEEHEVMGPFEPASGRVWKEWVSIDHANVADYAQHESLFTESIAFANPAA
jgi:hypothetical protein